MTIEYRFVQPVDTLSNRGNKAFGDSGSFGESNFPPRPSVLAGAFRSLLLSQAQQEIQSFASGERLTDPELDRILGIPENPGSFRISCLFAAQNDSHGTEIFLPLPSDGVVSDDGGNVHILEPWSIPKNIPSSLHGSCLLYMPVLRQAKQNKPESGWLLNQQGIARYQNGDQLETSHLQRQSELWRTESRVGIGLSEQSRTAKEGRLFSVEHTSVIQSEHKKNGQSSTGLIVGISGCGTRLPDSGFLRLGGDGRAACFYTPGTLSGLPVLPNLGSKNRFKIVLISPGIFRHGWLPDGIEQEGSGYRLHLPNCTARLACAALSRFETVSGWDLAKWTPKPAERAVPAGSVYWFDELDGDPSELGKLVDRGFWPESMDNDQRSRQAEGFNRILIGAW